MKSAYLIVIQLFVLFYFGQAHSQSVDSTQVNLDKKMVKAITNEKGEVVFVFHDGREAQVFYGPSAAITGQIKLQQVENSCEYELPPANCEVIGYYENIKFQIEWTKHSDPQKIGQVVEKLTFDPNTPAEKLEDNQFLTDISYQKMFRDKPEYFPKYKLRCDQTQWIQKINESQNRVLFSSVTSELMFQNQETDVNENQSIAEIYNAQFELVSPNTYELTNYHFSSSAFSFFDPLLSTQVIHFVYSKNNKSCHVAFAANAAELTTQIGEMQDGSQEIKNKKVLKNISGFANTEVFFSIQDMLRAEKDSINLRYK